MDPNETLKRIRAMVREWHEPWPDSYSARDADIFFDELIELVEALDEWMSKGGFSPWGDPRGDPNWYPGRGDPDPMRERFGNE